MLLPVLSRLYNAAMNEVTPTSMDIDINDVYRENAVADMLIAASETCAELPANVHCTVTIWYHPATHSKTFTLRVKSRNRDWKKRKAFFHAVQRELRFY